jgi:hypothetical protein
LLAGHFSGYLLGLSDGLAPIISGIPGTIRGKIGGKPNVHLLVTKSLSRGPANGQNSLWPLRHVIGNELEFGVPFLLGVIGNALTSWPLLLARVHIFDPLLKVIGNLIQRRKNGTCSVVYSF